MDGTGWSRLDRGRGLASAVLLLGAVLSATGADPAPAAAPASPPINAAGSVPSSSEKLDPGFLSGRLKLRDRPPTDPSMNPGPSDPGLSRRGMLRMKDEIEERKNWMFVDPGQLHEERERKEGDPMRDRWERKDDLKAKAWWEFEKSDKKGEKGDGSLMDSGRDGSTSRALLGEGLRSRDGLGLPGDRRGVAGFRERDGSKVGTSSHQYGELNFQGTFSPTLESDRYGAGAPGSSFGLNEIFGSTAMSAKDRDQLKAKRQEFRNFLDGAPGSGARSSFDPFRNPDPGTTSDGLRSLGRLSARDGLNGGGNGGADGGGLAVGSGGLRPGGFNDFNTRPGGFGAPASPSGFGRPDASRPLITPDMMSPPKRRF